MSSRFCCKVRSFSLFRPFGAPSPQGEGLGADCVCKFSKTFPFGEGGTALP